MRHGIIIGIVALLFFSISIIESEAQTVDFGIIYNITKNHYDTYITGGEGLWSDGGNYIYPNHTFADNIQVYGYIQAWNWNNVSITKSQITDWTT